jgi:hypothetical protein
MTIDEIISDLTELKICGVVPFTKGTISGGNYKVITGDCIDEAVTILQKYQKIQEIYESYDSYTAWINVKKVVEDGNDNRDR